MEFQLELFQLNAADPLNLHVIVMEACGEKEGTKKERIHFFLPKNWSTNKSCFVWESNIGIRHLQGLYIKSMRGSGVSPTVQGGNIKV